MSPTRLLMLQLVCVAFLAGCPQPSTTAATPPEAVLRAYDVQPAYASELREIINSLLNRGKDVPRIGSVAIGPGGQLMVSAPASFQAGVEKMVQELRAKPPTPPPAVAIDYWIVVGQPAGEGEVSVPAKIAPEVAGALEALQKSQGPMKLGLIDRLRVQSASGASAKVDGAAVSIFQTATQQGGKVLAEVEVSRLRGPGRLATQLHVPIGKTVVLGQAGTNLQEGEPLSVPRKPGEPLQVATMFYLVRAEVAAE